MDLRGKRIVVTGGKGFVGSHIIEALIARGVGQANIIVPAIEEYDLRDKKTAEKVVEGANVVIHLAGVTGDAIYHREHAGEMFYDNLLMGAELMEASRKAGVEKFVGVGSATEYPADAPMPLTETDIWNGPLRGDHIPYSFAKKMMAVQAGAYKSQYNFTALHLLPTNMYGPGERLENNFVIPVLIKRILEAKDTNAPSITVWGTGAATRDFLYVGDAAEGIILATENYESPELANIGSGTEASIKEVVTMLCGIIGYEGDLFWDATKPDGQLRRVLDARRAKEQFGFSAATPLELGLRKTVDWYVNNKPH